MGSRSADHVGFVRGGQALTGQLLWRIHAELAARIPWLIRMTINSW
jgi:hypothetical protein